MPELDLTPAEKMRVLEVSAELDDVIREFFADARAHLTDGLWSLLLCYSSACVRRALEVGTLLHAIVDATGDRAIAYPGRGRDTFVRKSMDAWRDSFAPIPDGWRMAEVFADVPGGERRVLCDVATLEVMAANRMFDSLDSQSVAFLSDG